MLKELDDYDWGEAFGFAGETKGEYNSPYNHGTPRYALPTGEFHCSPFGREDVIAIHGMSEGENDEREWLIYGRLKDGRHFFIAAGCDYTGWD